MKIKSGFKVRKMCGSSIVVAVGKESSDFNGMITLNDTGELLWNSLSVGATEQELVDLIIKEYEIDEQTARGDVQEFINKIKGAGFLEQ